MDMVTEKQIYGMIRGLLNFPYPQICRHAVALDLLNLLEQNGATLNSDMVIHIVQADDEKALALVERLVNQE